MPAPSATTASVSGLGYTASIALGAATGSGSLITTGITATPPAGTPTYAPTAGTTIGYLAIQNPNANPIVYAGGATLTLTAASGLTAYTSYALAFNPGSGTFFGNINPTTTTATAATFNNTTALAIPAGATQVFAFYSVPQPTPNGVSAAFQCPTCTTTSALASRTPGPINFAQPSYPQSATVTLSEPLFTGAFTSTTTCASPAITVTSAGATFTITATAATAACAVTFSDGFSAANNVTLQVVAPAPVTGVIQ